MNGYDLSRSWFDFSFENPEKIHPVHSAIFFFAIEHCNRLGWKDKFGFPTSMAMDALGIKKYQTYMKYFNDLVEWGFFELIEKSKNQYSSNIICLASGHTKNGKALDKAFINHAAKQTETTRQSTGQSVGSIYKQVNNKQFKPQTKNNTGAGVEYPFDSEDFLKLWSNWKDYKKQEHRFSYKTPESEQAALMKLNKLASGSEPLAKKIIMQSIENGWKGFFELKQNGTERLSHQQQSYLVSRKDL